MDLLAFDPDYHVVVYRRCQYAIVPKEIPVHLQAFHRDIEGLTSKEIRQCVEALLVEPTDPLETT
jgi:hypothetical protein